MSFIQELGPFSSCLSWKNHLNRCLSLFTADLAHLLDEKPERLGKQTQLFLLPTPRNWFVSLKTIPESAELTETSLCLTSAVTSVLLSKERNWSSLREIPLSLFPPFIFPRHVSVEHNLTPTMGSSVSSLSALKQDDLVQQFISTKHISHRNDAFWYALLSRESAFRR